MGKKEKKARQKRLEKQKKGLLEQADKHKIKLETEPGDKDTTPRYWESEMERLRKRAKQREEMLEKLRKKKINPKP